MDFKKIELATWSRKEYFEHYFTNVPCTYSMTVKLDITRIKKRKQETVSCNAVLYYHGGEPSRRIQNGSGQKRRTGDLFGNVSILYCVS